MRKKAESRKQRREAYLRYADASAETLVAQVEADHASIRRRDPHGLAFAKELEARRQPAVALMLHLMKDHGGCKAFGILWPLRESECRPFIETLNQIGADPQSTPRFLKLFDLDCAACNELGVAVVGGVN